MIANTTMANTNMLRGDERPDEEALWEMINGEGNREGTRWAAYQNQDLGHPELGHLRFLAIGPHNTLQLAPPRYPETPYFAPSWRYVFVGWVNLATGDITST